MANVVAFIHARGGSKRCPGKNTRMIAGKPLIAHTILQAQVHPLIDKVVISTDSLEIAGIALAFDAPDIEVLTRPPELCTDDAIEYQSWKYGVDAKALAGDDIFVNLPCTCPLRSKEDITKTIEAVLGSSELIAFTAKSSREHRFPDSRPLRAGEEFVIVGACYAARPQFIRENESIFAKPPFRVIEMDEERTIDIDTEYDFKVAKLLMEAA